MTSAQRLFLGKGVDETTVEDITAGAAVSKGAFYLHFSSKGDVVEALRARFVQDMLDRIQAEVGRQPEQDWTGKLRAWVTACAACYLDSARLHALLFAAAPSPAREGLTRNILIDDLAALLTQGHRAAAWTLTAPAFTAVFLFGGLHGLVTAQGLAEDDLARSAMLQELEIHCLRLVAARPRRPTAQRSSAGR